MGLWEAAEALGVSRERIYQLRKDHPQFPEPCCQLRCGPIWYGSDIRKFIRTWSRKAGRPKRDVSA